MRHCGVIAAAALILAISAASVRADIGDVGTIVPSQAAFSNGDLGPKTLYTGAGKGAIMSALYCNGSDAVGANTAVTVMVAGGGVSFQQAIYITVAAWGFPGYTNQNMLLGDAAAVPPFGALPSDQNGNPVFMLASGDVLSVKIGAITAPNVITCRAWIVQR